MANIFEYNKPSFNFNLPKIKVDVSVIPVKYKPNTNPIFQVPPTQPKLYYNIDEIIAERSNYSKIVFLIRHGARDRGATGKDGELNSRGIARSISFGETMVDNYSDILDDTYMNGYGTDYKRTKQTVAYILNGIDSFIDPAQQIEHIEDFSSIHGNLYTGDITDWSYISEYCSTDHWEEISYKSKQLINNIFDHIEEVDVRNKHFHIMVSHDQLLAPFIYYASKQSIHPTPSNWVYFLSGVALLLYEDNTYELVPLMGTDDWYEMPS